MDCILATLQESCAQRGRLVCRSASKDINNHRRTRKRAAQHAHRKFLKEWKELRLPKVRVFPKWPHGLLPALQLKMRRVDFPPSVIKPLFAAVRLMEAGQLYGLVGVSVH